MITKILPDVWKLNANSNLYYIESENTLIDTGDRSQKALVEQFLSKVIPLEKISKIILTHLHYDHIGNFDLFPNARFFASKQAIQDLKQDSEHAILSKEIAQKFNITLNEVQNTDKLEIIDTPGHTKGSICIWYKEPKILFTGDTILRAGYGRTDLPTSDPDQLQESVIKLLNYPYKIMCPGHDY